MPKPGTAKSILVLEDEILYLEMAVGFLERLGFEVLSARTVDEAVTLLQQLEKVDLETKTVDAIWLDHFLPEKNGNVFIEELRKHETWRTIPVFLVSNAVETEIVNWYMRAGVRQHFPKINNSPESIAAAIDLFLQQHPVGDLNPDTIHRSR